MPRPRPPAISFELDARLELLSALVMLARPKEHARRFKAPSPYAEAVRVHFSPFAKHPAIAELGRMLERGVPEHLFTELILLQSDASSLELEPLRSGGLLTLAGGEGEMAAFFEKLRDFAARSSYEAFFRSRKADHRGFFALARAEAAKCLKPEAVCAYLRTPFPGTCRLILAPLLPQAFAANTARGGMETRVRCGVADEGALTFEYDVFDSCVAHELAHALMTPLIEGSRKIFDAYPGKPPKACRDAASWSGCLEEHLVRAITLRALKLGGDEKSYQAILRRYAAGGYPFLADLCARLDEYERTPEDRDFADFYPGLIADFSARTGLAP